MSEDCNSETTRPSLLDAVRDPNNHLAWADFVEIYQPRIASWCHHRGLQASDVDEVTQTVLAKLVEKMRQFDYDAGRGSFRGWLKTVTVHALADYCRSERRRLDAAQGGSVILPLLDSRAAQDGLMEELEEAFQRTLLREAEARVRRRGIAASSWNAFFLRAHKGLPSKEVAQQLGMTPAAVDMARARVQKMLAEEVKRLEHLGG